MPLKTRDRGKKEGARVQEGKRVVQGRQREKNKSEERGEENINTGGRTRSLDIAHTEGKDTGQGC